MEPLTYYFSLNKFIQGDVIANKKKKLDRHQLSDILELLDGKDWKDSEFLLKMGKSDNFQFHYQ